jgi:hypothetical protein
MVMWSLKWCSGRKRKEEEKKERKVVLMDHVTSTT